MTKDHGYVFEVDPHDRRANRDPKPIKALGRYAHEAVVVDPKRGHLYLTEDASGPNGLLYRWTPPHGFHARPRQAAHPRRRRGRAPGLQVLRLRRQVRRRPLPRHEDRHRLRRRLGRRAGPRRARPSPSASSSTDGQITRARKLEGMWWGDGGAYIVSSYAREESPVQHDGQVWFYDPKRRTLTLKVLLGVNPDPSEGRRLRRPRQHHRLPVRRPGHRRGRRGRPAPVRRHRRRPYVPDRPQRAEHRHRGGAGVQRVHRRHLLARRRDPVRQHPGRRASCSPSPGPGSARSAAESRVPAI